MSNKVYIQGILGVDKKNPVFTINRQDGQLHVYFGMALMEIVPDDKTKPAFKMLLGRLFNSGIKKTGLIKAFNVCYTTMKRWGDALKSNDLDTIARVLSGPGAPKKITSEIKAFIAIRFQDIYQQTHYGYSQTIRDEIKFVFNETISAETLRPLFSELKISPHEQSAASPSIPEKLALSCELAQNVDQEEQGEPLVVAGNILDNFKKGNRKYALIFSKQGHSLFCNHAGVLLFSSLINRLTNTIDRQSHLVIQWLTSILLGMVNIEQTKLIDPESIKAMLGTFLKSLKQQRVHLGKMATDEVISQLFAFNCDLVQCHQCHSWWLGHSSCRRA